MTLSIIAAVAENGIIGRAGQIPWHIGEDLKHFKQITFGHPVVMGRKTFESLGRRLLPGRLNIVITRNHRFNAPNDIVLVPSLENILIAYRDTDEELFIIGGGEIYRQAFPMADKLYLTHIHASPDGDTHFPSIDPALWRMTWCESHPATDTTPAFDFTDYFRIRR